MVKFRSLVASLSLGLLVAGCAASGPTPPTQQVEAVGENAASPAVTEAGYRLDEGDRIAIQVFDEPDLTIESIVGASGFINYSYLGNIRVAGKRTVDLEQELTGLLSDGYLVNPSVNVTILEYRPFFINGEVNDPGGYPYQPGLTVDRAIALAGGLTDRASTRRIFVSRDDSEPGKRVDMSYRLAPGQVVTVDEGFF